MGVEYISSLSPRHLYSRLQPFYYYFNPYDAEIFFLKTMETKGFFQFEIIINVSVSSSASYEYLCCVFMADINIVILSVRGSIRTSD